MPVSIGVALVCLALQCVTSHGVVYRRVAHSKYPNIWAECTTAEEPTQTSPRPFVAPPPVVKSVAPPPPAVSDTIPTATTTTSAFNQPILPSNTNKAPIVSVAPSPSPIVVLPESIAASPSPQPVTPPPPSPPVSNDPSIPYVQLPSGFPGVNTGIASWFRANNPQDSTNGNSWCGYPYNDNMPGMCFCTFLLRSLCIKSLHRTFGS